eukprot:scaffold24359_cov40-Prasinocladus_malaysianus.AAC.1
MRRNIRAFCRYRRCIAGCSRPDGMDTAAGRVAASLPFFITKPTVTRFSDAFVWRLELAVGALDAALRTYGYLATCNRCCPSPQALPPRARAPRTTKIHGRRNLNQHHRLTARQSDSELCSGSLCKPDRPVARPIFPQLTLIQLKRGVRGGYVVTTPGRQVAMDPTTSSAGPGPGSGAGGLSLPAELQDDFFQAISETVSSRSHLLRVCMASRAVARPV